ncbi:MAG: glycoside hydrolase family 2 TIM barrel-domain containing protein [Bacteroidota bacterium]
MKKFVTFWLAFFTTVALAFNPFFVTAQSSNNTALFDDSWRFFRGSALGGERVEYNDAAWRKIDLPHDWSIEDLPNTQSPFDMGALSQVNGGFTTGGIGWYRKHFKVAAADKGKRFVFQFDGVYMNCDVWLNGKRLGIHPYGYTSFVFDATDQIKFDAENIIAVRVRNEGENSRWYSGSGIYRHVWLKVLEPLHIAQWGTHITTSDITPGSAKLNIKTTVVNKHGGKMPVRLVAAIVDAKGKELARETSKRSMEKDEQFQFEQEITLANPVLWGLENPSLYKVVTTVYEDDVWQDEQETSFGIRSISFDATNGFRLNGKTVKLKGGCVHHDNGPLGAKAYDRAEERKVELLKASGFNAIRTSHNPPSTAFLDACDRLGMLVIDEAFDCWETKKNPQDYSLYFKEWWQKDIESMVLRDRNHPSIIMWSTGNEIPNRDKPEVVAVSKKLTDFIHQLDPTRPVTCGVNGVEENKDPLFKTMDVAGYNYALDKYESEHKRVPERVVFAAESFPSQSFDYWMAVEDHPYVIGDFVWTAFDYIGEASIGWLGYPQRQFFYPWNLAFCGDIDVCGWKRPQSYYRDALWKPNQLSLFIKPPKPSFDTATFKKEDWAHWDWRDAVNHWNFTGYENKSLPVEIYSSCDQVELLLNGKSLGKNATNRSTKFMAMYNVPYQPGELKVIGYTAGKKVNESILRTAAKPVQLKLTSDKKQLAADNQDLSYITVEIQDSKGIRVPTAEDLIQFKVEGPASIVGVGNANPMSVESCQLPQRKAWQGRCLVIIKSAKNAGPIKLTATTKGLPAGQIIVQSK